MPKLLILLSFLSASLYSQDKDILNIEYNIHTKIPKSPKTKQLLYRIVIPFTIKNKQEIRINYSTKPHKIFTIGNTKYAEWKFRNLINENTITINIKAKVYKHRYKISNNKLSAGNLEKFLKPEKWIESNNKLIIKESKKIQHGKNVNETAQRILQHICDTLKYDGYTRDDIGALACLKIRKGDCTEYTDLFVALCRAKGIPARAINGFVPQWNKNDTPKHSRAEYYSEKYGWVPVDPLWTDLKIATKDNIPNRFIYLSEKRNDSNLDNYSFWFYRWWGERIEQITSRVELIKNTELRKLPASVSY